MTDSGLSVTIQPTALAAMLESSRTPHQLVACHGVLTPQVLDAPESEIAALVQGAALHDLGWMRRVAVRGEDRFRWLSGMVTNTVNDLFPNSGAWNLVLNAQGRIQGDLTVWRGSEEASPVRRAPVAAGQAKPDPMLGTPFAGESSLELEIASDQFEKLMAHFEHFIIMDDVELIPLDGEQVGEPGSLTAIGLTGPRADDVLGRMGLPCSPPMTAKDVEWNGIELRIFRAYGVLAPHYEFWVPSVRLAAFGSLRTAGATQVGGDSLENFASLKEFPPTASTSSSAICPRKPRRCARCTSPKAATLARRLWSAFVRAATSIVTCGRLSSPGRCPPRERSCFFPAALPPATSPVLQRCPWRTHPGSSRSLLCALRPRRRTSPLTTPTVEPPVQPAFWLNHQPFRAFEQVPGKTNR